MSETDPNDPGPVPSEKPGRRLNIALSDDVERILRLVSGRTSISIANLRTAIEESPRVAEAAKQALRFCYDSWVKELEGAEDIFGAKEG